MALTTYMVGQASDHLSDKHKALWVLLFKKLPKYQQYAYVYNDTLVQKLDDADGTIKARMLNALMKEIDSLGVGEVHIGGDIRTVGLGNGDRDGTHWSQTIERLSLIEEGLDVLFEDISTLVVPAISLNPDGTYRSREAATGQRKVFVCCSFCSRYYCQEVGCRCRL